MSIKWQPFIIASDYGMAVIFAVEFAYFAASQHSTWHLVGTGVGWLIMLTVGGLRHVDLAKEQHREPPP